MRNRLESWLGETSFYFPRVEPTHAVMMMAMSITLTCICGQQQYVAPEMAGQTFACVACGKAITVPAMGVLAGPKTKAPHRSASWLPPILMGILLIVVMVAGGSFLAWTWLNLPREPQPIAHHDERPHSQPPVEERKKEASKLHAIEPIKPKVETPKQVLPPVQPKETPKPKIELPKSLPVVEKKPVNVIEPVKLVWKLREGETFLQEVSVTQKPTFKVQGLPVMMFLQYQVVSRFTVKKQNADGSLVVDQKIEDAKFIKADDLSKASLFTGLLQLQGTTYTFELSPKMDVTKFTGGKDGPQNAMQVGGGLGLQTSSLIDRDGWKELAQATFFQLDQTPTANLRWSKPMTHNWGSLGSWNGQINYLYIGQEKDIHRVSYGLKLAYKAPVGGMIGGMKINGAEFQPPQAEGALWFDTARGRVVAAEERFRVRGVLNATLLGQNTLVEIDEDQNFVIRILEK
jgi:hypothetical protein